MMVTPTGINISFAGTRGDGDDSRPVVARIFGLPRGQDEPISREMVVPAGQSVAEELPEGLYNVQLTLPSGRILQRNVRIDEDSNETYQFFEDFVPNAGFSLQEAVGRSERSMLAESASASGNTSGDDYLAALERNRANAPTIPGLKAFGAARARFRTFPEVGPRPPPPVPASLTLLAGVGPGLEAVPPAGMAAPLTAVEVHGNSALWRIEHAGPQPPDRNSRRWARVVLPDGGIELASLPLPWLCTGNDSYSTAEVLVDPSRCDRAATTVAVRDARLAGLLAFLDRGQASAARPLLEQLERENVIEETIREKRSNPLAACAAAYVGLAVYDPQEHEVWDSWLASCMAWFPGVPDAAIVHARRLILRPNRSDDNALAAKALRTAFASGVPFFSAGIPLLREMLLLLSADFQDLAPLADKAARLAARVDGSQIFTVLRYAAPQSPEPAA